MGYVCCRLCKATFKSAQGVANHYYHAHTESGRLKTQKFRLAIKEYNENRKNYPPQQQVCQPRAEKSERSCIYCQKCLTVNRDGMSSHLRHCQPYRDLKNMGVAPNTFSGELGKAWNTGLTKHNTLQLAKMSETLKTQYRLTGHHLKGRPISEEFKRKLSKSRKEGHANGTIKPSGWRGKESYPEKSFTWLIEKEFNDQLYYREYFIKAEFINHFVDFAWPHKKKIIEIDGEQHYRTRDAIVEDMKRDMRIISLDEKWEILRIRWTDMNRDPEYWTFFAKLFIDD